MARPPAKKTDGRANNGGHNKFVPTEEQIGIIKGCAAAGTPIEDVCELLDGIDRKTWMALLQRDPEIASHYKNGQAMAHMRVGRTLYQRATDTEKPDITAAIYYTKARMGWREKQELDVNVNYKPIVITRMDGSTIELSKQKKQQQIEQPVEAEIVEDKDT